MQPGGRDLRRCRGNDPCSDDFVSTTRRANQCASALADFAQDRRLTSTRRTLTNILGRSVPYFDDLPHVVARPSVPSFASSILLPEFLGIMARNVHVFPSPHGKLHTFTRTIDLSVFAPRSFAYYRACSLTLYAFHERCSRSVNGWEFTRLTVRKNSGRTVPKIPISA